MSWKRITTGAALLLVLGGAAAAQTPGAAAAGALVLKGRLIDGTGAPPLENAIVVVEGERIRCAGTARQCPVPRGARIVEVHAGTILPGLIDLHVHVWDRPMLSMFLPAGVTTIRDLHNTLENLDDLAAAGPDRPRLFRAGPLIDGRPLWPGAALARTPEEARAAVDSISRRGVDLIKLYHGLSPESFRAGAEAARRLGKPVTADLFGSEVDALQALEAGVTGFEHAGGFALAYRRLGGDPTRFPLDGVLLDTLARAVIGRGAYVVPTLIVQHQYAADHTPSLEGVPLADRVSEPVLGFWARREYLPANLKRAFADNERFARAFVKRLHELGGRIGAGSDLPNPYVTPGGALHQELELLVEAGLTPLQAIHAATGAAAGILGRGDLGVVAAGRAADLVVVEGDPSRRIRDTRNVRLVVREGRLRPVEELLGQAPPVRARPVSAAGAPAASVATPPAAQAPAVTPATPASQVTGARPATPSPAPVPDGARLRTGTFVRDVTFGGQAAGVDTFRVERAGAELRVEQREETPFFKRAYAARLAAATLSPLAVRGWTESNGARTELDLAFGDGRVTGRVVLPAAAGGAAAVDFALPGAAHDPMSLAAVVAALPLAEGEVWSLPVLGPTARSVAAYRLEVGAVEAVRVGAGEVRAYPVTVEAGNFKQKVWISEAAPRWIVATEIPAFGYRSAIKEVPR